MGDSYDRLVEKVQTLSDLELAVLICLIAEQHCIIQTEHELLENVEEELKLVRAKFTQRSPIADPIRLQQLSSASHGQCSSATSRPLLTTLAAEFLYRTVGMGTSALKLRQAMSRYRLILHVSRTRADHYSSSHHYLDHQSELKVAPKESLMIWRNLTTDESQT